MNALHFLRVSATALLTTLTITATASPDGSRFAGPVRLVAVDAGRVGYVQEAVGILEGYGFTRIKGNGLPETLDGWTPHWYWPGAILRSARFWPIGQGDRLKRDIHDGKLYVVQASSPTWKLDGIALCPPVGNPDVNACLIPAKVKLNFTPSHPDLETLGQGIDSLSKLQSRFPDLAVIGEETRATRERAIVAAHADTARIIADKQKAEDAKTESAHQERLKQRARTAEWLRTAQRGTALMCSSGAAMVLDGGDVDRAPLDCDIPQLGRQAIHLAEVLNAGWILESRTLTPASDAIGRPGVSVSAILRKG